MNATPCPIRWADTRVVCPRCNVYHPAPITWSDQASICWGCRRPFRISEEAIAAARAAEPTWTKADACNSFTFCLGCVEGASPGGEYDVLAHYGYRFEKDRRPRSRRWVILLCWKRVWYERSQERATPTVFARGDDAGDYVGRLNGMIAAAKREPVDVRKRVAAQRVLDEISEPLKLVRP